MKSRICKWILKASTAWQMGGICFSTFEYFFFCGLRAVTGLRDKDWVAGHNFMGRSCTPTYLSPQFLNLIWIFSSNLYPAGWPWSVLGLCNKASWNPLLDAQVCRLKDCSFFLWGSTYMGVLFPFFLSHLQLIGSSSIWCAAATFLVWMRRSYLQELRNCVLIVDVFLSLLPPLVLSIKFIKYVTKEDYEVHCTWRYTKSHWSDAVCRCSELLTRAYSLWFQMIDFLHLQSREEGTVVERL